MKSFSSVAPDSTGAAIIMRSSRPSCPTKGSADCTSADAPAQSMPLWLWVTLGHKTCTAIKCLLLTDWVQHCLQSGRNGLQI